MSIIFMKKRDFFSSFFSLVKMGKKYSFGYKPSGKNYIEYVHSVCDVLTHLSENYFNYYDYIQEVHYSLRIDKIVKFIINDDTYILIDY